MIGGGIYRRRRWEATGTAAAAGASDNFNRADTTTGLGTSSSGHTWTPLGAGVGGISTNRAFANAAGTGFFEALDAGLADGDVSVTIAAGFTDGDFAGVTFRVLNENNGMTGVVDATTGYIVKRETSSNTTLSSAAHGGFANGDVVRVVFSGSAISLQKGVVEITSTTSSFQDTETLVGLHSLGATTRFDDFAAAA